MPASGVHYVEMLSRSAHTASLALVLAAGLLALGGPEPVAASEPRVSQPDARGAQVEAALRGGTTHHALALRVRLPRERALGQLEWQLRRAPPAPTLVRAPTLRVKAPRIVRRGQLRLARSDTSDDGPALARTPAA